MPDGSHRVADPAAGGPALRPLVAHALARFVEGAGTPCDAGPVVLASLLEDDGRTAEAVAAAWLDRFEPSAGLGLHGGLGALVLGLGCAARRSERVAAIHARLRRAILERVGRTAWSRPAHDWPDYDLVTGPAGLLLALCADPAVDPAEMRPLAEHLAALLASDDMGGFRIRGCRDDPQRSWNAGAVNLGLAHGVGGPIAALTAFVRRSGGRRSPHADTLVAAGRWLLAQAHEDPRRLRTWAPCRRDAGPRPASRREAWCYGAPGIAWILWDAGTATGRADLRDGGLDAFRRVAEGFDPGFHLDAEPAERLAVCHGAAGVLLIADAFARHARSGAGERLARRMEELLEDARPAIGALAEADLSLLAGGGGILAALLTRAGGDRTWLAALALR